jgi:creatinine amidohydrolase
LFNEAGDHAGEMETSLMMHLCPDKILSIEEAGEGKFKTSKLKAVTEAWAWTERPWPFVTEDTGIGNPRLATAEKGKKYFDYITDKVAGLLEELSGLKREESYKFS